MKKHLEYSKIRVPVIFTLLLIILIAAFGFQYTQEITTQKKLGTYADCSSSGDIVSDSDLLYPGNIVTETVKLVPGEYKSFTVFFDTLGRANSGTIAVNINSDSVNQAFAVNASDLSANPQQIFTFDQPIKSDKTTTYQITVRSGVTDKSTAPSITARKIESSDDVTPYSVNGKATLKTLKIHFNISDKTVVASPYILGAIISLILLFAIYLVCRRFKKIKIEAIAVAAFAVLAIGYSFVFAPMTVPDEPLHYLSAYNLSNRFMMKYQPGQVEMRDDDYKLYSTSQTRAGLLDYYKLSQDFSFTDKSGTSTVHQAEPIEDRPLSYVFSSVGITIGRIFDLGAYPTFYLGRFMNLLLMALCLYFSMKLMPFGKIAMFAVATLPMTLHLAGSFSYDVYNIGLCMVLIAYLIKLIYSHDKVTITDLIIVSAIAACVIPYKSVYIGIGFLAFLIPKGNFKSKAQKWVYRLVMSLAGVVMIIPVQFARYFSISSETTAINGVATFNYTLHDFFTMPIKMVSVFCRTIATNIDWYYNTMIGGSLAWFQIDLPSILIFAFTAILILTLIRREDEPQILRPLSRAYVGVLFAATAFLILFVMLLDCTPYGGGSILGVQGRYLLPVIPMLLLLTRNNTLVLNRNIDNYVVFGSAYLNIFALLSLYISIISI